MQSETTAAIVGTADSKQIAGTHYKTDYQHWSMLPALGYGPEYFIGQATKYLTRWRKKNGLRDLLKAQHFIEKLAELVEERGAKFLPYGHVKDDLDLQGIVTDHMRSHLDYYFKVNDVDRESTVICLCVMFANSKIMLEEAVQECQALAEIEKLREPTTVDVELPVAQQFAFIEYIDEGIGISWQCKHCGLVLNLRMNEPPNTAHKTCESRIRSPVTITVPA